MLLRKLRWPAPNYPRRYPQCPSRALSDPAIAALLRCIWTWTDPEFTDTSCIWKLKDVKRLDPGRPRPAVAGFVAPSFENVFKASAARQWPVGGRVPERAQQRQTLPNAVTLAGARLSSRPDRGPAGRAAVPTGREDGGSTSEGVRQRGTPGDRRLPIQPTNASNCKLTNERSHAKSPRSRRPRWRDVHYV